VDLNDISLEGLSPESAPARSLYSKAHQEFRVGVQRFLQQLAPSKRSLDHRRIRLKNQLTEKLQQLSTEPPPSPPFRFIQEYTWFVSEFGSDAANAHEFTSQVNELAQRIQWLTEERLILEQQRVHFLTQQETTTSVKDLEKLLADMDRMSASGNSYRLNLREFTAQSHNFQELFEQVAWEKKRDRAPPAWDARRLKKMLNNGLDSLQKIPRPSEDFKKNYYRLRMEVGPHQTEATYLADRFDKLNDQYLSQKKSWDHLQLYAAMMSAESYDPNELRSTKRIKDVIRWAGDVAERYHIQQKSMTSATAGFHQECLKVRALGQDITLKQKVVTLHTAFMQIPKESGTEDLLSKPFSKLLRDYPDHRERAQWESSFGILNDQLQALRKSQETIHLLRASLATGIPGVASNRVLKKLERDVLTCIRLTNDHNARTETYLSNVAAFTRALPVEAGFFLHSPLSPQTTPGSEGLTTYLKPAPDRILMAIRLESLAYNKHTPLYFTPDDRLKTIRSFLPTLPTNVINKAGAGVIHEVIGSRHLSENEKVVLLRGLKKLKADFNQPNAEGKRPLNLAALYYNTEDLVIKTLQDLGASPSEDCQVRITAHLLGTGGTIPHRSPQPAEPPEMLLEGLTTAMAQYGLDPVIRKVLQQNVAQVSQEMKPPLQSTLDAWAHIRDYSTFIHTLEAARSPSSPFRVGPSVLMTGWKHPNPHAIGFVFNQEADGSYLYACNTGSEADPTRTIVKYRVVDFEKTIRFFSGASHDLNETRSIYVGTPSLWGLERCPEEEQIPAAIDKSSQKRGSCPMAARKACALAILWSTSRDDNVPPEEVKSTYKALTTDLRKEGVQQAIDSHHPILQGKALVSLLTKLDRPGYDALAYKLANVIMRQQNPRFWWTREGALSKVPATDSPQYLATIRSALTVGGQDLRSITSTFGEDLAILALRKGNSKAATTLQALIDNPL